MNVAPQQMYQRYPAGAPHRSPHGSAARRGPGPMMATSHPQAAVMSQAQMQAQLHAQQVAAMQHHNQELAKRRSRKPMDKTIPEGVEDIIGGDLVQQYRSLRDLERRTDATMMRKRLDVQDAVHRNVKRHRTLRVWISNTVENQPWQDQAVDEHDFDFSGGPQGSYRVKIEGRLLDEEDHDDEKTGGSGGGGGGRPGTKDGNAAEDPKTNSVDGHAQGQTEAMDLDGQGATPSATTPPPQHRFSHFFKSITVQFHGPKTLQPDGTNQIEWRKPAPSSAGGAAAHGPSRGGVAAHAAADFDALFFERKGDEDVNVTISLVRDENPERYWVSKELGEIVDRDEDDRARVVMGIYEYVRALGLQEAEEKRGFRCDEKLRSVFQRDFVFFHQVPELIAPHLKALPPIEMPYTIRVGKEHHQQQAPPQQQPTSSSDQPETTPSGTAKKMQETIYDIQVNIDDPLKAQMTNFIRGISSSSSQAPATTSSNNNNPAVTHPTTTTNNNNNSNPVMTLKRLASLDEHVSLCTQALIQARNKLDFLDGFSRDPIAFLYRWLSSQQRDLELVLGEGVRSNPLFSTSFLATPASGGGVVGTITSGREVGATAGGGGAGGGVGGDAASMEMANLAMGMGMGMGIGMGLVDDHEWRRGGPRSLWARDEVKEAVLSLVTSTTTAAAATAAAAAAVAASSSSSTASASGGMAGFAGFSGAAGAVGPRRFQ